MYYHPEKVADRPVVMWEPGTPLADPATEAYCVRMDHNFYEQGVAWPDKFATLLAEPRAGEITALVVGQWAVDGTGPIEPVIEAMVAARGQLSNLQVLFVGAIEQEESEISWIEQGDVSPLFAAFPKLQYLGLRGGNGLDLGGAISHDTLKTLIIETGGLPERVLAQLATAKLPNLEALELWLGTEEYGGAADAAALVPLITQQPFPKLRYLGLCNCQYADDLAARLADAPILDGLETLDLSMGALGDAGAAALLANPKIKKLQFLNLHHHYCTDEVVSQSAGARH